MREEEIGREGLITYTNLLQLVCRLQGSAYDNYGEIEQVKKEFNLLLVDHVFVRHFSF